jgi:short-subunit dehydrogenase
MRALVTGASSGIGAALARRLAARGLEVWLAARRRSALDAEVAAIVAAGGRAHALELDVADADATVERLARLDEEAGGIDLVVANAGTAGDGLRRPGAQTWASSKQVIGVNLLGAIATLTPFIPRMIERGAGQLVGVSSIAAHIVNPSGALYSASKAGLSTYLESIDIDLRPRGVAVTCVEPGFVDTAMAREHNDRLPLLLTTERAVEIIDLGIQRRARVVRFPWLTGAGARVLTALPRPLRAALFRRLVR